MAGFIRRGVLLNASALTALSVCGVLAATEAWAGDITGTVKDAGTSKPLAGVTVDIPGSAFKATTGADGAFVLSGVPAGQYNVEAYVRGYDIGAATLRVPATGAASVDFSARPTLDEIVVVSNRFSARRAQLKAAQAISVLSESDLQHTAVHNAAEVLGLMPSVNVMMTGNSFIGGIDGASRGEGQYVSIRSMNAEYNVNLINGIEVATAQPYSRGVQLNLIPPSGLQTVILNKTSTADMDGDAIGGTIDFRTPTAFDFAAKQTGSISFSGNYESQAHALHAKDKGYGATADFSRKFGPDENFGVYVSGYYNRRNYANSELGGVMEAAGGDRAYALSYVDASGNIPASMNPIDDLILAGFNVGVSSGQTKLWGGTASLDWRPDADSSYYAHFTYAHDDTTQNSILNQIVGEGMVRNEGTAPVDSSGAVLPGYVAAGAGLYQTLIPSVSNRLWYETNPETAVLSTVEIGARKAFGSWHIEPSLFYSFGRNDRPDHLELWTTSIPTGSTGSGASPYGAATLVSYRDNFPIAHLTPGMQFSAENPGTMPAPCCYELTAGLSDQKKYGGRFDAGYDFAAEGLLRAINFGAKYITSERHVSNRDYTVSEPSPASSFAADTTILSGYYPGFPGHYDYPIPVIVHSELDRRFKALTATQAQFDAASDICTSGNTSLGVTTNYNCNTLSGTEDVAAGYVSAKFGNDVWEIIPGARYESAKIHNNYWVRDINDGVEKLGHFASNNSKFSEFLPSIFFNYRPTPATVYRASIWTSYTRPPFFQLGGSASTKFDPATGTTTVTMGNPDLKPVEALNFDVSGTWTTDSGGFYSAGLFYKRLSHYLYDSGTGYVNGTGLSSGATLTSQPRNGGDGKILGLELEGQQRLSGMPAPFDGISIGGNVTFQSSKVDIGTAWGHDERIQNAPDITGNAGVYYAKGGFSLDILYHYSGAYVAEYDKLSKNGSWDDLWIRPVSRLDLHAGYEFGQVRFDLSVANLLGGYSYWSHIGEDSLAISDVIDSGRTVLASVKYKF
jgi:TonB-dependent receptor